MIHIGVVIIVINPPAASPSPTVQEQPIEPIVQEQPQAMIRRPGMIYASCEVCGWENEYETLALAKMGMGAHRGWCKRGHGRKVRPFG